LSNFQFFVKFSIFCQIFNFLSNFQFFVKFSIFLSNFQFFVKFSIVFQISKFLSNFQLFFKFFFKFSIVFQIFNCFSNFKFFDKFSIFRKKNSKKHRSVRLPKKRRHCFRIVRFKFARGQAARRPPTETEITRDSGWASLREYELFWCAEIFFTASKFTDNYISYNFYIFWMI